MSQPPNGPYHRVFLLGRETVLIAPVSELFVKLKSKPHVLKGQIQKGKGSQSIFWTSFCGGPKI